MVKKVIVLIPHINLAFSAPESGEQTEICEPGKETQLHLLTNFIKEADGDLLGRFLPGRLSEYSDESLAALNSLTAAELKRRGLPVSRGRVKPLRRPLSD